MNDSPNETTCPACGDKHFVEIPQPRNGRAPFHWCRMCNYAEAISPADDTERPPRPQLTPEQQQQAFQGYTTVARWCADYIWTPDGAHALDYLRKRGFTDAIIREAKLGFHPDTPTGGVGPALWEQDQNAYQGARSGGLLGLQGRPKSVLRGVITIPYWRDGTCVLLRTRRLE